MENPVLVSVGDGARKLRDQRRSFSWLLAITGEPGRKRSALRELHAVERRAVVLPNGIDWQHAFVLETRGGFRFGPKTIDGTARLQMPRQNHFQRDDPRWRLLSGAIHDAHPAARHFIQQLVIFDPAS